MRLLLLPVFFAIATTLEAQGTIARATDLMAAPGSRPVATLRPGAEVRVGTTRSGYTEVTVEGWVSSSFVSGRREQYAISIRGSSEDVRLRGRPNTSSAILAEMRGGMGLTEVSRRAGWVHVRRTGWVPSSAVRTTVASRSTRPEPTGSTAARQPATTPAGGQRAAAQPAEDERGRPDTSARSETAAGTVLVERVPVSQLLTPGSSIALRRAPEGDAVATVEPGARMIPVARERGWVRVQIEGWVREAELMAADTSVRASLSAADLRSDPERLKGQTVRWEVQVLSYQLADPLRRDLGRDEPYLLARGPGSENAILYLAVPPSLVESARTLPALSTVSIIARVRNGRSEPAGVPVLELQSLARLP